MYLVMVDNISENKINFWHHLLCAFNSDTCSSKRLCIRFRFVFDAFLCGGYSVKSNLNSKRLNSMQSAIEYSICPSRMKLESKKKPVQKYYIGYQSYRGIPLDYNGNCFYCHHHFTPTTDGCVVVVLIICKCKVHLQVCLLCIGHNVQWLITIVFIRLALNVVHTHTARVCTNLLACWNSIKLSILNCCILNTRALCMCMYCKHIYRCTRYLCACVSALNLWKIYKQDTSILHTANVTGRKAYRKKWKKKLE